VRLLLAGCGHTHLFVLEALARGALRDAEVTLVSPGDEYFYSGMIPGVVAGCYEAADARFRPPWLARAAGARWVRGRVHRVDPQRRRVLLDDGEMLDYDVLSLDIGAAVAGDDLPGVREHAVPVKPMSSALGIITRAEAAAERAAPGRPARVVVVGGGTAGVEMAICLDARLAQRFGRERHSVTILESSPGILAEHSPDLRGRVAALLGRRGIRVETGVVVEAVEEGAVVVEGGSLFPADAVLWAAGPRPHELIHESGFRTDDRGYLRVRPTLESVAFPDVFGAGDCVALESDPWVPRAGVYAVRAGPVLAANLRRFGRGEPLREFQPQRNWLSLMNTGDGRAFAHYRKRVTRGRAAWWLKDWIDRRFMRRFQRLEQPA